MGRLAGSLFEEDIVLQDRGRGTHSQRWPPYHVLQLICAAVVVVVVDDDVGD